MIANADKIKENLYFSMGTAVDIFEEKKVSLPLYLSSGRWFRHVCIAGTDFILVGMDNDVRFNITTMIKQRRKYEDAFSMQIAFAFFSLTFYQRKALIENGIAFVTENEQVFLPFAGVALGKCARNKTELLPDSAELLTAPAQLLLLFLLYSQEKDFSKSTAASQLGVSPMTITRAVRVLQSHSLVNDNSSGRESRISLSVGKTETLRMAEPFLISPVKKILYVEQSQFADGIRAGEYSLADRTDFGYPQYREYALNGSDSRLASLKEIDPGLFSADSLIRLQIWRYDPQILSFQNAVDPISLISSFQGNTDERIHKCLEQVRKEIPEWQITRN